MDPQLSQVLNSLITLLVGFAAYVVYKIQKGDSKRDAANIIMLELRNAERNLEEARKSYEAEKSKNSPMIVFPEKLRLMTTESWTKYKYLFVRDLTPEQWDEVGKFYENCKLFDEAVELKESSFGSNAAEIRANVLRIVGDYSKELGDGTLPNPEQDAELEKRNVQLASDIKRKKDGAVKAITGLLIDSYGPDKPFNDAAYYYSLLPRSIVNTPTGQRFVKLAARRRVLFWRKH